MKLGKQNPSFQLRGIKQMLVGLLLNLWNAFLVDCQNIINSRVNRRRNPEFFASSAHITTQPPYLQRISSLQIGMGGGGHVLGQLIAKSQPVLNEVWRDIHAFGDSNIYHFLHDIRQELT